MADFFPPITEITSCIKRSKERRKILTEELKSTNPKDKGTFRKVEEMAIERTMEYMWNKRYWVLREQQSKGPADLYAYKIINGERIEYFIDAIKLDILMQRRSLGTPFIDNFSLTLEDEFNKVNVYENVASTLIKMGGRVGNLMDTTHDAMSPDSPMGKEISKTEKDQIYKAINEVEEKIAKLKLSIK